MPAAPPPRRHTPAITQIQFHSHPPVLDCRQLSGNGGSCLEVSIGGQDMSIDKKSQLVLKYLIFINIDTVAYTITQIHTGSERKARRSLLKCRLSLDHFLEASGY